MPISGARQGAGGNDQVRIRCTKQGTSQDLHLGFDAILLRCHVLRTSRFPRFAWRRFEVGDIVNAPCLDSTRPLGTATTVASAGVTLASLASAVTSSWFELSRAPLRTADSAPEPLVPLATSFNGTLSNGRSDDSEADEETNAADPDVDAEPLSVTSPDMVRVRRSCRRALEGVVWCGYGWKGSFGQLESDGPSVSKQILCPHKNGENPGVRN